MENKVPLQGHSTPRVAPPLPRVTSAAIIQQAAEIDINLMPWQQVLAQYTEAGFREVAAVVARQNGKTTFLVPLIISRLRAGWKIMHTAQNRTLPLEVHGLVSDLMIKHYRSELKRNPRYTTGQEDIQLHNGGKYQIVAPTKSGARGQSRDLVIIDELREMDTLDFISAAKPTLTASPHPQIVYLSNAGTDSSVVLNALKARSANDPGLAYLEWSAGPQREADDVQGWLEANPAIGHLPGVLDNLHAEYRANLLGDTMPIFETEHLCRWASSLQKLAFRSSVWAALKQPDPLLDVPEPFALGIGVAPGWQRATVCVAAQRADGRIGVEVFKDLREKVTPQMVTDAVMQFHVEQQAQTIAYDVSSGGAGEFDRHSAEAGLPYDGLKPAAMVAATMDFSEMVMAGRIAVDDPLLDAQISNAVRREVGADGAYRFSRGNSIGPIDAVEAALLAAHAISYSQMPGLY